MKKKLVFLLLIFSIAAFAQIPEEELMGNEEAEAILEDSYEQQMFLQKQEDFSAQTSELSEDTLADEEVFDSESDYND